MIAGINTDNIHLFGDFQVNSSNRIKNDRIRSKESRMTRMIFFKRITHLILKHNRVRINKTLSMIRHSVIAFDVFIL